MSLTTAQNYIYHAFRVCGQMRAGYTLPPELMQDGLDQWNALYDGYNAKRTMAYSMPDYVFSVNGPGHGTTGNGQTFGGTGFEIGPTAQDFVVNAPRPPAIVRMNLYYTSTDAGQPTRLPMSQISMEEWMNIAVINLTPINVSTTFAYDPQWPNGVIWVWPPLIGNSLEIFTWGALVPPTSLSQTYTAPPGYADLIIWQLAMRLWPYCTKDMMPERRRFEWVAGQAEIVRQRVAAVNAPSPRMRNDFSGSGGARNPVNSFELLLSGVPY